MINQVKLIYPGGLSEGDFVAIEDGGWLKSVEVVVPEGKKYMVQFYDPVNVKYEIVDCKLPYLAEAGLIILPKLTRENMHAAVEDLYKKGYFDSLRPL